MDQADFVRVPQTRQAIATLLAALIVVDLQSGQARSLPDSIAYGPGADVIASPPETIARGTGSSLDLTRLAGGTQGDAVGCVGDANGGFYCFLTSAGRVIDPSVGRGVPAQPDAFYAGAATAPIQRPAGAMTPQAIAPGEPTSAGVAEAFQPVLLAASEDLSPGDLALLTDVAKLFSLKRTADIEAMVVPASPPAVLLAGASSHAIRVQPDIVACVVEGDNLLHKAALWLARLALDAEMPAAPTIDSSSPEPAPTADTMPTARRRRPTLLTFLQRGFAPPGCGGSCGTTY